jgi:hypothetical protein
MHVRERFTYANVVSTLALVLVIGGGGAYAAGFIDSGDIVNNSIESRDLENREAVKARDVRKNGLTGKEIKEKTLDISGNAPLNGAHDNGCDPEAGGFLPCVNTPIRLRSPGRVMAVATGEFVADPAPALLQCRIFVNGAPSDSVATPGENGADEDGFAITLVTNRLARGSHQISLRCQEDEDEAQLASSSIAVIGVSG